MGLHKRREGIVQAEVWRSRAAKCLAGSFSFAGNEDAVGVLCFALARLVAKDRVAPPTTLETDIRVVTSVAPVVANIKAGLGKQGDDALGCGGIRKLNAVGCTKPILQPEAIRLSEGVAA